MSFPWNNQTVATLKQLHADGFSFSHIANELTTQFRIRLTRSAAIGKANRLGLERAEPTHAIPRVARPPRQRKVRSAPFRPQRSQTVPLRFVAPAPVSEPASTFRCDLVDLTNEKCRWPIGEGPFQFCGAPEADLGAGIPYCRWHSKRAYRRTSEPEQGAA